MQFQKVAELSILTITIEGDVHHDWFSATASLPALPRSPIGSPKQENKEAPKWREGLWWIYMSSLKPLPVARLSPRRSSDGESYGPINIWALQKKPIMSVSAFWQLNHVRCTLSFVSFSFLFFFIFFYFIFFSSNLQFWDIANLFFLFLEKIGTSEFRYKY